MGGEQIQIFPEYYLIKVNQFDDVARDTLDEWIYFLKNETIEDNFQAKGLKLAKEQLDVLKLSPEARRNYEAYVEDRRYQASMFNSSFGRGRRQGNEEGRAEEMVKLLTGQAIAKFDALSPWAQERLNNASEEQLEAWSKTFLKAETLEAWLE